MYKISYKRDFFGNVTSDNFPEVFIERRATPKRAYLWIVKPKYDSSLQSLKNGRFLNIEYCRAKTLAEAKQFLIDNYDMIVSSIR